MPVKRKNIRVVLVEDHPTYREIVSEVIESAKGFALSAVFENVNDALEKIPAADVVLMDIGLPQRSGIEGVTELKKRPDPPRIIMLTNFTDDEKIMQAIIAGADGYLLKQTSGQKILEAIEETMNGGTSMTPFVARRVLEAFKSRTEVFDPTVESISLREQEVLGLLVQGLNYKQIAEKIFISPETVRNHIRNIYEKLHVHSRSEAVSKAIKQGLVK
ncbi:MAG: response regulator transcription factor [Bacteriovoracaceae bacterium]|nr:response regulator transcription factor [Bacteroidota bacterium]